MVTGETFRILASAICKTRNVIYLMQCLRCRKQYVGETENSFHIRLNGHKSDIKNHQIEKPVPAHFSSLGHSMEDIQIMVIERIQREDAVHQRRKESYWINTLRSIVQLYQLGPIGHNENLGPSRSISFIVPRRNPISHFSIRNHPENKTVGN